jgi:UDP-N-acetylglucosamine 1-carboxyvinyltransferase
MDKIVITGGNKLQGTTRVSGAKNVALKAAVAACLTDEQVTIHNVPLLSDFRIMMDIIKDFGGTVKLNDHTVVITLKKFKSSKIALEEAALTRTASMFIAPLLARNSYAIIPNPGGCRIGARPIDRTIEGLKQMGADIDYFSEDGFFHASTHGDQIGSRPMDRTIKGLEKMGADIDYDDNQRTYHAVSDESGRLKGVNYHFDKNTHTGTETLIIAATLADGTTVLENAAQEPEIDELIDMLNSMGAKVKRVKPRTIEIIGVKKLHGTEFTIGADRNEIVTFAIGAIATQGVIFIEGAREKGLEEFLTELDAVGGGYEIKNDGIRFFYKDQLKPTDVTTTPYPGFMTDWQAPWAILMTQANGKSVVHETVFESRFGYVKQLQKMGAKIEMFNPKVENPEKIYNFNISDEKEGSFHAITITGPAKLHDASVEISDLRAGATLAIAALVAEGTTSITGIEKLDRGYEAFEKRLTNLGAKVKRITGK